MRSSLEQEYFTAYYQPQFDIASGRIIGVEALVRWVRPAQDAVPPSEFIPIAESTGLINQLGESMLRIACTDCRVWQQRGLVDISVSVNVSPTQFRCPAFVETILNILQECALEPRSLGIELTEETVMRDFEEAADALHRLRQAGVRLAIDDFGTGYSSLGYLKRFPVDRLKIDQSFIAGEASEAGDQAITRAIIRLSGGLNIDVTAEGVKKSEQLEFLAAENCGSAQGHHFARPMPFGEFVETMSARNAEFSAAL